MIHPIKSLSWVVLGIALFCFMGCKSQSLYSKWGQQLSGTGDVRTIEDVSQMLGTPPYKCENIEPIPMLGVRTSSGRPTIESVLPNGTAWLAGMQIGEVIIRVGDIKVNTTKESSDAFKSLVQFDKEILIETNKKTYSLTPKRPKEAKQCYWDINAGTVGKTSGGAYINPYGGSAGHSGSQYDRFFRASCRFYDGRLISCRSNWQE